MDITTRDDEKKTARVESFSDCVISIAITLLILNIKVPTIAETAGASLSARLLSSWPSFLAFAISFGMVLVMWVNHHRVLRLVRTTDYPFLYWNGFLLMTITFVPYPTALLAEHLRGPHAATAMAFYAATAVVVAVAYSALWRHLVRHPELLLKSADPCEVEAISQQYRFGPLMYLIAFGVAFVSVDVSIAICFILALYFGIAGCPRDPKCQT